MKLRRQKTDFSTIYSLKIGRHEFMLGHLNMGSAVQDAEDYGEENVNDRLGANTTPAAFTEREFPDEHPLAAHDPFAQGPIAPEQIKAALDRIMLEHGPVCTTRCNTTRCAKAHTKLNRRINGAA